MQYNSRWCFPTSYSFAYSRFVNFIYLQENAAFESIFVRLDLPSALCHSSSGDPVWERDRQLLSCISVPFLISGLHYLLSYWGFQVQVDLCREVLSNFTLEWFLILLCVYLERGGRTEQGGTQRSTGWGAVGLCGIIMLISSWAPSHASPGLVLWSSTELKVFLQQFPGACSRGWMMKNHLLQPSFC